MKREFYTRGKPKRDTRPPRFSYETRRLWDDLNKRLNVIPGPFDISFTLTDIDLTITIRVVRTDASNYSAWSINRQAFIYNDCVARKEMALNQMQLALLRS